MWNDLILDILNCLFDLPYIEMIYFFDSHIIFKKKIILNVINFLKIALTPIIVPHQF